MAQMIWHRKQSWKLNTTLKNCKQHKRLHVVSEPVQTLRGKAKNWLKYNQNMLNANWTENGSNYLPLYLMFCRCVVDLKFSLNHNILCNQSTGDYIKSTTKTGDKTLIVLLSISVFKNVITNMNKEVGGNVTSVTSSVCSSFIKSTSFIFCSFPKTDATWSQYESNKWLIRLRAHWRLICLVLRIM